MTVQVVTDAIKPTAINGTVRSVLRRPVAVASLVALLVVVIACALAPLIASFSPLEQNLGSVMQLPSAKHLLGTDTLGRDELSRLLWGGQPALWGALEATVVFTVLGVGFGLLAGYGANWVDRIISAVVDILMSLPSVVVIFAVLALFSNNLSAAMITLGLFSSGGLVRVVRAVTQSIREELYVSAARVAGLSPARILFRHIAPRVIGPTIVQVSLFVGIALIVQSGLGFLNLGVVAPAPSWGGMLGEAAGALSQDPWLLVPPGVLIGLMILVFGLIGDSIRDANAENKSRAKVARGLTGVGSRGAAVPPSSGELLHVSGLTITFNSADNRDEVVHGIALDIKAGELVGLVGESGSGKTVTALALLGLLPGNATVTADSIDFDGHQLVGGGATIFRSLRGTRIGLISQEPMVALDPAFTVGSQLREVIKCQSTLRGTAVDDRVRELLQDVQLPDPADVARRYPHELSGGMAQRVVIAIALAGNPQLLIADEPTTALDVTVQAQILDLLRRLRDERGMAILLVTHDLGVIADICERAYVMQQGEVIEDADVLELFDNPTHEYTRQLLAATPSLIALPKRPYESEASRG
jgi:peptide/nickel transport system permease protein